MGTTLTLEFLEHIKRREERIMHEHLTELRHPQWGSIVGYEADVRVAVLEDELEIWKESPEKNGHMIQQLEKRIEEVRKDAVLFKDSKGDLRAILEEKNHPNELHGPGPDEEK
tara:strand:+ start:547 stop:885 length:339 start_codon:yes stop_codon:yes gene_type:complete